jgi:hypothetical protein
MQCRFFCLKIYTIEGVYFDSTEGGYIGYLNEYSRFGIGSDINDICMKLANDKYSDDLEKWSREKNAQPPFLITTTTNNVDYIKDCKWSQRKNGQIYTHGCFSKAKHDLDEFVEKYEVPYIPVIVAMLTFSNNLAKLTHIDTSKYGITIDGETLFDSQTRVSGKISSKSRASLDKSFSDIVERLRTYVPPGERFSRLMYSSMQELDNTKSFLFAWTSIEVFINISFSSLSVIDFPEHDVPELYASRITKLFSDTSRGRKITTVAQKYAYLSIFQWKFLGIVDYDTFLKAKSMRDKFTHGDKIDPSILPTRDILVLVSKIIRNMSG